jgi:hypothetical protein
MLGRGVISAAEGRGAERGLRELLELIEAGRLLRRLSEFALFGPCEPPRARPMRRGPVPSRMQPGTRQTWWHGAPHRHPHRRGCHVRAGRRQCPFAEYQEADGPRHGYVA